jgi:hypothetical protein
MFVDNVPDGLLMSWKPEMTGGSSVGLGGSVFASVVLRRSKKPWAFRYNLAAMAVAELCC